MAEKPKPVYDESKIKTLSSLEHIRLRTGMYIGRLGDGSHYDDGCYVLLKEVIDNAIDEYIMGYGKEVQISIDDTAVSVRDFGRGIPLGKVVDCVSKINTGAKYNDDVFQFSVGLNGVGTKAVNALSKEFFESALTALVPTPFNPTLNWKTSSLYFAPVLILDTQSTTLPSGMPRPKSRTDTAVSSMLICTSLPWPMMNSSMALSMTSLSRT